nr:PucR family transcriptional regulator ligand-binding domain-containing protein [Lachnospiraceae bacterium]
MVLCSDIKDLRLDGVELLAGEAGLNRSVSWTYAVQTRPYEDHMNKGNFALLVVDYVRYDIKAAYEAMIELDKLGISGFAVSVMDDKEELPDYMLKKADE